MCTPPGTVTVATPGLPVVAATCSAPPSILKCADFGPVLGSGSAVTVTVAPDPPGQAAATALELGRPTTSALYSQSKYLPSMFALSTVVPSNGPGGANTASLPA